MRKVEIGELKEIDAKEIKYLFHKSGNPINEALMLQDLMQNYTQQEVSKTLEISQGQISKRLRLLRLHPVLQERLKTGEIRPSTAYVLSKLSPETQKEYMNQEKITLKEVEERRRKEVISKEVMETLDKLLPTLRQNPANYQSSYWKAVELQEKVENGTIKIPKRCINTVVEILQEIQNAAFKSSQTSQVVNKKNEELKK